MSNKSPKLEIAQVLQRDADEIVSARNDARILHKTNDISTAGSEVERTVRNVLSRKLSKIYYVGHGHIVDSSLETSPQLDVIIVDNFGAPRLFEAKNGTEYFPYESVYAIGEIKTTYYKSQKCIHELLPST